MAVKRRGGPDIPRMNDVQLLAHLLGMAGLETTKARELSHALLNANGDLRGVLAAPRDALLGEPELGEHAAAFLLLLSALMKRYTRAEADVPIPMETEEDLRRLLAPHFRGQSVERVCAFLLGEDLRPFTGVLVGQGSQAAVTFSIRRVLELALNHNATGVILAHNHPDGVPCFSRSDLVSTDLLMRELTLVHLSLEDHYLLAGGRVISLRRSVRAFWERSILLPAFPDWFPQVW